MRARLHTTASLEPLSENTHDGHYGHKYLMRLATTNEPKVIRISLISFSAQRPAGRVAFLDNSQTISRPPSSNKRHNEDSTQYLAVTVPANRPRNCHILNVGDHARATARSTSESRTRRPLTCCPRQAAMRCRNAARLSTGSVW